MAASTSRAAPSMLRLRSNCSVIEVLPSELDEVISVTPAMWLNWRSSGVAIEDAMISGLPPGRPAETEMVGKSTCGKGETGRTLKAMAPTSMMPAVSRVVATGRRMNGAEMFMCPPPARLAAILNRLGARLNAMADAIEEDVDDRRGVERKHLAQQQSAHHGNAQRAPQLRSHARAHRQRNARQQRGHGGHHDGTEAQQAGLVDRVGRVHAALALALQREVHHHDAVLLHNADQQNDADDGHDAQVLLEKDEGQQRAHARRGQSGENRDGMNEALVENAEHDIDRGQRGQNQQPFIGERALECSRGALESILDAGRHVQVFLRLVRWP